MARKTGRSRKKPAAQVRKTAKEKTSKKADRKTEPKEEAARRFVRDLGEKERIALAVRDELYDGSWERMREDLAARKEGRVHVFRLASRIEEDLKTIGRLGSFERRYKVNLSRFLEEGR